MLSRDFLSSGAPTHKNITGQKSIYSRRISKDSLVANPGQLSRFHKEHSDNADEEEEESLSRSHTNSDEEISDGYGESSGV